MKATKYFEPNSDKMERGPQRSMCINSNTPLVLDWEVSIKIVDILSALIMDFF
jgi:hypothetical protein